MSGSLALQQLDRQLDDAKLAALERYFVRSADTPRGPFISLLSQAAQSAITTALQPRVRSRPSAWLWKLATKPSRSRGEARTCCAADTETRRVLDAGSKRCCRGRAATRARRGSASRVARARGPADSSEQLIRGFPELRLGTERRARSPPSTGIDPAIRRTGSRQMRPSRAATSRCIFEGEHGEASPAVPALYRARARSEPETSGTACSGRSSGRGTAYARAHQAGCAVYVWSRDDLINIPFRIASPRITLPDGTVLARYRLCRRIAPRLSRPPERLVAKRGQAMLAQAPPRHRLRRARLERTAFEAEPLVERREHPISC